MTTSHNTAGVTFLDADSMTVRELWNNRESYQRGHLTPAALTDALTLDYDTGTERATLATVSRNGAALDVYRILVNRDSSPDNPRAAFDHAGNLFFDARRVSTVDELPGNVGTVWANLTANYDDASAFEMIRLWLAQQGVTTIGTVHREDRDSTYSVSIVSDDYRQAARVAHYRTGSVFADEYGTVHGFIYLPSDTDVPAEHRAECLRSEIAEYSAYASGSVFYFDIERFTLTASHASGADVYHTVNDYLDYHNTELIALDGCSGYYGDDHVTSGLADSVIETVTSDSADTDQRGSDAARAALIERHAPIGTVPRSMPVHAAPVASAGAVTVPVLTVAAVCSLNDVCRAVMGHAGVRYALPDTVGGFNPDTVISGQFYRFEQSDGTSASGVDIRHVHAVIIDKVGFTYSVPLTELARALDAGALAIADY